MCKYCEEIDRTDDYYIQYIMGEDHYIAYEKQDKKFELWSEGDYFSSIIQYCPWCGRKLEALEEDTVKVKKVHYDVLLRKYNELEDDYDKLEERLNNICNNLYFLIKCIRWDEKRN